MKLVCKKCGSEDVEMPYMVNPNTWKIGGNADGEDYCWDCEDTTIIVSEEEFIKNLENSISKEKLQEAEDIFDSCIKGMVETNEQAKEREALEFASWLGHDNNYVTLKEMYEKFRNTRSI